MFEDMFDTFCGLKCFDCEFKEKYNCGGCITSGGKPFHGKCVKENNLNSCYECKKIDDCKIGYYGIKNEYIAKATTIFIKRYGEEIYSKILKKAINTGVNYPKTFDETGSVNNALKLLEKYIE